MNAYEVSQSAIVTHHNKSKFAAVVMSTLLIASMAGKASGQVYISEFLASNSATNADEDGEFNDWLELYNAGASTVNLDGWYLTDSASNRTKWRIPNVNIAAGGFLLVWASDKNRGGPGLPLHTNFKLGASGEYLGLIGPDGVTVQSEYAPSFPAQANDVSYGMDWSGSTVALFNPAGPARALVPSSASLGTTWRNVSFNDSAWRTGSLGAGYEVGTGYESLIGLDLRTVMYGINASSYIRVPFNLSILPSGTVFNLRMKYDDGFVAYLNGTEVARSNVPTTPAYNSTASSSRADELATVYQDFVITSRLNLLQLGTNVLAIQGLNAGANNQDFLIAPALEVSTPGAIQPSVRRTFTVPSPLAPNGVAAADNAPIITDVSHSPSTPSDSDVVTVTARVAPGASPVSSVLLRYRANFAAETQALMRDDGLAGDATAGDGVYTATIPASASSAGQMLRYYVAATDNAARVARIPTFVNPATGPEYLGTMIPPVGVNTQLPVFHWFVSNPTAAATDDGTRATVFYNGVLYDNIFVRLRGQSSAGWPKPHYKFDFNSGYYFAYSPDRAPVEEFNLQSTYSDKAYIRQIISWETYAAAGAAGCEAFPMRVQQNGAFHSVAVFVEQPDERLLERNNMDPSGALYKMFNECTETVNIEKKTRQSEGTADLAQLIAGVALPTGTSLRNFLTDNVDIPATISYIAATTIIADNDHVAKNYYIYRDTENSGLWTMLPWDKDLTFGRNYGAGGGVLSDGIWADADPMSHPLFGDSAHPKVDGPWNRFIDAMHRDPTIRSMYLRRLRTLMDEILQPASTPVAQRHFESRIDELVALMNSDVTLDRALWGNPYGENQTFAQAVAILKNQYLTVRRNHLFNTHGVSLIPPAQDPDVTLTFGDADSFPASGVQDDEYIQLVNSSNVAVDISGWQFAGDISHTFAPGTVIAAGSSLYVTPNVASFRARAQSPKGGEGLFVQGDYDGHLSTPCSPVDIIDRNGRVVATYCFCYPDFNSDGGIDGSDVEAFFQSWSVAGPNSDVNQDGGVDGADVEEFFSRWSTGGC